MRQGSLNRLIAMVCTKSRIAKQRTNYLYLHNTRVDDHLAVCVVMVCKGGFNEVRHRVSKKIRRYITNDQWTISDFWVIPTSIVGIQFHKALSPFSAKYREKELNSINTM
jgi:hypothetical protein